MWPPQEVSKSTQWLNQAEVSFVHASVRRRAADLKRIVAASAIALAVVTTLLVFGVNKSNQVTFEAQRADENNLARQTEEALKNTAVEARATAVAAQAESELARVALTGVGQLATDKERALMLTAGAAKTYRSWVEDGALRDVLASPGHTILLVPDLKPRCPNCNYGDVPMVWSAAGDEILTIRSSNDVIATSATTRDQRLVFSGFAGKLDELLKQLQGVEGGRWPAARSWPADHEQYYSPDGMRYLVNVVTKLENSTKSVNSFELLNQVNGSVICKGPTKLIYGAKPWSPTGEFFITADDTTIQVRNGQTCEEVARLTGDAGSITWAEWNATGEFVAGVSGLGHGRVWGLQPILRPTEIADALFRAWSPRGSHLLFTSSAAGDLSLGIWNADTQTEVAMLPISMQAEPIENSVILSDTNAELTDYSVDNWDPTGTRDILIFSKEVAQIWDAVPWTHQLDLVGHQALITDVDWSPSGDRVVTGSNDGTARVWDAATGKPSFPLLDHGAAVTAVAWSPDAGRIATGAQDGTVRIWNASTGQLVRVFAGHTDAIQRLTWNPNIQSQLLLSETRGNDKGSDSVWQLDDGRQVELPALELAPTWSPTGSYLGGVTDEGAQVWSIADWSTPKRIGTRRISWSPRNGAEDFVATQGENSSVLIWNLETFTITHRLLGHSGDLEI